MIFYKLVLKRRELKNSVSYFVNERSMYFKKWSTTLEQLTDDSQPYEIYKYELKKFRLKKTFYISNILSSVSPKDDPFVKPVIFDDGINPFVKSVKERVEDYFNNGDNVFPKPMTDYQFKKFMKEYFLGEEWCTANPVSDDQANVYIALEIIERNKRK